LTTKGKQLREDLVKKHPDQEDYVNGLMVADVNMVSELGALGRMKEALPYAEQAAEIGKRIYAAHPEDPDAAMRLGVALNNLGGVYRMLSREDESKKAHRSALEVREKLTREHPTVLDYSINLSGSYINLGELAENDAHPQEALEWLGKGEQTLQGVLEKEPKEVTARYYLSYDYSWEARAYEDLGKQDEASKRWALAIEYDEHNDPQLKLGRAMALAHKGEYERAIIQADELAKQENLPETLYRIASVYALASDSASAAKNQGLSDSCREKAFSLLNRIAEVGYFKDAAHVEKIEKDNSFDGIRNLPAFIKFKEKLAAE